MARTRKVLVVGTLVAASITMAAMDGAITLRKSLRQGIESYHMSVVSKATITLAGADQDMNTSSTSSYTYKIGTVDSVAGQAPVELTTKVEKVDMDGPLALLIGNDKDKLLITTVTTGKVDSRNRIVVDPNAKVDAKSLLNGTAATTILGPYMEFPEKPINVGDTWDVAIPKGPTTSKEDQKLTAKLVGEKDLDGTPVYLVQVTGSYKTDVNMGEILKANPVPELEQIGAVDMLIKSSNDVTGDLTVDKVTGQTITMNLKVSSKQEVVLPNLTVPSVSTATIKVKRDK